MKLNYILFTFGLLLFITGCVKQLNVEPRNAVSQERLSSNDIPQLRNAMYSKMEDVCYKIYWDFDMRGENFVSGPGFSLVDPLNMAPNSSDVLSIWRNLFKGIYSTNVVIAAVDALENASEENLGLRSEALFFRAYLNYQLVIRWGEVPIINNNTLTIVPQSNEAEVWKQIHADLQEARKNIPSFSDRFYASDAALFTLWAKVHLAQGDFLQAAKYADSVIRNKKFKLANDAASYAEAFIPATTSAEVIFALANNTPTNIQLMYSSMNDIDGSWNYSPDVTLQKKLYQDAKKPVSKSGDIRLTAVFGKDKLRTIKYPNGNKGQQLLSVSSSDASTNPIVLFRLAELYLIKAEALGKMSGAATLNTFFKNRYAKTPTDAKLSALSDKDYQLLILDEYRREFYGEGHFWYDVKRANRLELFNTLNGRNYLLKYPIPQVELDLAGYKQNPDY